MPTRSSKEQSIGNAGESAVESKFQTLQWGAIRYGRDDIGTDLVVLVRSASGLFPELLIGAQVKTSELDISEPTKPGAETPGFWFRDRDRSHVDDWLAHPLPHLIILHSLKTGESYWEHITEDSVKSTGKGAKILVPTANKIDENNRDALVRVAESINAKGRDGTAWTGAPPRRDSDLIRHAMLVPRVIAPHPNLGAEEPISSAQGIALMVQGRIRDYDYYSRQHDGMPEINEAKNSSDWRWRFAHGLARLIQHEDSSFLTKLIDDAPDSASRVAAVIATCCAYLDQDQIDEAKLLLEEEVAEGEAGPIDKHWISVQQARLSMEIGELDKAWDLALEAQQVLAVAPGDLTASAIAGAGANLLFNTGPRKPDAMRSAMTNAIKSGDTPVAWWRNQTVSRGLAAVGDEGFKQWSCDETVTVGGEDVAWVQFLSASMLSSYGADQGGWRRATSLRGKADLLRSDRHSDPADVSYALRLLVRGGDAKALKPAVRHLRNDGPTAAIGLAAESLRLAEATHTSALAELQFIQYGGSVLGEDQADRIVKFLIELLFDDVKYSKYVKRVSPTFWVEHYVLASLAEVIQVSRLRTQRGLIKRLANMPPVKKAHIAQAWVRVIDAISRDAWTKANALSVKPKRRKHSPALQKKLTGKAALFDRKALSSLVAAARQGSSEAVVALDSVTLLSNSAVKAQIKSASEGLRKQRRDAKKGACSEVAPDPGELLVLLNIWHPEVANWKPLLFYLEDDGVPPGQKYRTIAVLSGLADKVPENVRAKVGHAAFVVSIQNDPYLNAPFWTGQDPTGPATVLAVKMGSVDLDSDSKPLVDLLRGDSRSRQWATHVTTNRARPEDVGVMATLGNDSDPVVRAVSASGLAYLVARGNADGLALSALEESCNDPGILVPVAIAEALRPDSSLALPQRAEVLLETLRNHKSPLVRQAAAR